MDFTEKDLKKKLKNELVAIAKTVAGFNANIHKKKEDLISFLLKREIKPSKRDELMEKASKFVDFKKSVHGASIAKLEAFLKSKEKTVEKESVVGIKEKVVVVEKRLEQTDLNKLSYMDIRRKAKAHGWNKRTGTRKELIAFIKSKTEKIVQEEKRLPVVVEKEKVEEEVDIEDWPISDEIMKKHGKTVDDLKKLLKAKGIATGLPRTKKEILELFKHSRCSFKNFSCSEEEFCDLRNNLCRELNILRDKDNAIKKLAKGLIYIDEEKGRFYGTPDAIAKVREALLRPVQEEIIIEKEKVIEPVKEKIVVEGGVFEQKGVAKEKIVEQEQKEEQGISPININRLLDKPSENEIRRAILHCLGLYHDIDPNDEVIMS